MPKKAVGKVYKSVIMMNKVRNFEKSVAENPDFLASLAPPHLLPSKPSYRNPLSSTTYDTLPTFRSLYSQDPSTFGRHPLPSSSLVVPPSSSPPSTLLPLLPHPQTFPPLLFLQNLIGGSSALASTALNDDLALQMITHTSHPPAQRGTAPHNLKMAFMGRRVLEMHLQMFLLHAEAQRKEAGSGKSVLIDTQRATEKEKVVVVVDGQQEKATSTTETEQLAEGVEEEAVEKVVVVKSRKVNRAKKEKRSLAAPSYLVVAEGVQQGDGTPGGLMDSVLSEYVLGRFVGEKWNLSEVMLYDAGNPAISGRLGSLNRIQGSLVQSVFGGLSHAYGAAFTSRFFHAHTLPLLESRMPQWTHHYIEEQRLKVLEDGGIWGEQ
ncbi:hypothetical protein BDY24DRAFT_165033 [Mrakia frigida]|uniref:uncharacterized protein n=1 Tax=Mrakia frigida TaxID=29902 RepID=UPI003FCBF55B